MAEVRPRLLDFAAEMLGGLARKDQRAAGELYVRGLLTDGQRKSMQPMAARLGTDHQRLQQFITSSTWDYGEVRGNVARWFAAGQPVDALVIDDTGFPKDGTASPCVARQYSGTLGKTANCQIGVSAHLAGEHASCAADWRLFCPESWDDKALDDPVRAARARRRREQARIPDDVRHEEKWRLALEMIDEMTGPGGWGRAGVGVRADVQSRVRVGVQRRAVRFVQLAGGPGYDRLVLLMVSSEVPLLSPCLWNCGPQARRFPGARGRRGRGGCAGSRRGPCGRSPPRPGTGTACPAGTVVIAEYERAKIGEPM